MPAVTFTIESDAVQGDDWREGITELVDLFRSYPDLVHVARTSGGRREASTGKDAVAAAKRLALMETLPEVTETGLSGVTRYDEGIYGGPEDQERLDTVRAALWPDKKAAPDLSEANDALNLATHLKYRRDYFVTTDKQIHRASDRLNGLGINVVTPGQAAASARSLCETKAESS
jgi:hypothetical protein